MGQIIEFTDKGLYCPAGRFYIDPWEPVDKAIITHAHSDHARAGHKAYLSHHDTIPFLQLRLGEHVYQGIGWNELIYLNGVKVSLHPAGHIIGSSQVRIEQQGEVWVVSGDYKVENDGISGAFEPEPCNVFITESTFGLPIYNWKPQETIYNDIRHWIHDNQLAGKTSVLIAYSLGKAQRVLQAVAPLTGNIFVHGAIYNTHQVLTRGGWNLPEVIRVTPELPKDAYKGQVVIAPPSADGTSWMRRFAPFSVGVCSGWMQVRGHQRRRNADAGFALSDHADWKGLLEAVKATGASKVFATHGFQSVFSRYLNEQGIEAAEVKTAFGGEEEEVVTEPEKADE
ncbi:ligase-associated DNA damage response exonuclease [Paraflavitalea sp. CAU 1676]|uniref:ligase-associated DNA damage response exonuclease n=1 Tax=Paraflavitalea sp. CAU 1676 TaxID=3032598 RepID=UPI0023DB799F|nr:ligase-associated DNA damage response exonuclease [Paraflavitalea sp. CAU 1676]MDF2189442.1 ligase-associated DNA damage response exonuclease [Paraflavitalea sp. CAU 1676]